MIARILSDLAFYARLIFLAYPFALLVAFAEWRANGHLKKVRKPHPLDLPEPVQGRREGRA